MSKPSFYNDNEYRAYPFVVPTDPAVVLPDAAIVDAGFIVGLDAEYDDVAHKIYLRQVTTSNGQIRLFFSTTAPRCNVDLQFSRDYSRNAVDELVFAQPEWTTEHVESAAPSGVPCAQEPLWSGFIVTGKLDALVEQAETAGGVITFSPADSYTIEPARVQNLNKAFLRSVSVGNYARVVSPPCTEDGSATSLPDRNIILNAQCLRGAIKFKEGYNTKITQTQRSNTLTFTAVKGTGAPEDEELCANNGEVPLYAGEAPPDNSLFLSGGPACKDLMFTINGLGGRNVNIIGGKNIQIGYSENDSAITVKLADNAQGRCNG